MLSGFPVSLVDVHSVYTHSVGMRAAAVGCHQQPQLWAAAVGRCWRPCCWPLPLACHCGLLLWAASVGCRCGLLVSAADVRMPKLSSGYSGYSCVCT